MTTDPKHREELAGLLHRVNTEFAGDVNGFPIASIHYAEADAILSAGWVRITEDEETVEKLAYTLAIESFKQTTANEEWNEREHFAIPRMVYEAMARAALRALREETDHG